MKIKGSIDVIEINKKDIEMCQYLVSMTDECGYNYELFGRLIQAIAEEKSQVEFDDGIVFAFLEREENDND